MKKKLLAGLVTGLLCVGFGMVGNAFAVTINFATGQDSSGNIQTTGNSKDANWTTNGGQSTYVTTPSNPDWYGGWGNISSPNSSWIAGNPNSTANGIYSYTYTFDLTGYNLLTAVFNGMQYSMDDAANVYINGNLVSSHYWGGVSYYFQSLPTLNSYLLSGVNTILLSQYSTDNYLEAMRFEGTLNIRANPATVPEPGTWLLMGSGLVGLAALRRKFARK